MFMCRLIMVCVYVCVYFDTSGEKQTTYTPPFPSLPRLYPGLYPG